MSERLHGFVKSHGVRGETTAPVLTMEPPWVRFLTGDRIVLTCDAGRRSRSKKYIWHKSDRGDRTGEESYTIMNASKNDSGVYKCKTTTDSSGPSTPYSNTIHVNITEPDRTTTIETLPEILWVNENLLLRCHFPFPKDAIYTFYREGFRLGEATVSNGSGTFEIQRVSVEDKGRYRCELHFVNFPNGPIYSSAYKFVDIKDIPVRLSVKPETPKDGDTITLSCECSDSDACGSGQYSFYRNNSLINSDSVSHNDYLIPQATVMDSGRYHCSVLSNSLTHTAKSVEMTVRRLPVTNPHLNINPVNGSVREGGNLTLRCIVTAGSAPIEFTWYRGEMEIYKEISSSREVTHQLSNFHEGINGNYSCSVYNNMSTAVHSPAVEVEAEVAVSCPSLISNLNSSLVALGHEVTFTCKSHRGTPPVRYQLYRGHRLLANMTVLDSGPGIFNFALQEGGVYSCGAVNGVAAVTNCNETMELTAAVPVSCPDFISVWGNSTFAIGDRARLTCKCKRGTPPIQYLLNRDGQVIDNRTVTNSGTGNFTFTVASVADGGLYSCGADNGFGRMDQCGEPMRLTVAVTSERSLVVIYVAVGVSFLILALLILLFRCKRRRHNKGNPNYCNQTGTDRISRLRSTPVEHKVPSAGEIVYAEVQVKRKAAGDNGNGAGRIPGKADYYVTYATLNHLQMERDGDLVPRQEEEGRSSDYVEIYQNVRRL
ncbi:Fc receptor-like protein 5 isoform X2 [Scyliorhinus torazame]|uniref:Fc receptor-like protein 5 isoform X2 n=1 Tax=Scyliorhinus torazame TaxID=75743 RepID=UPI003B5A62D2